MDVILDKFCQQHVCDNNTFEGNFAKEDTDIDLFLNSFKNSCFLVELAGVPGSKF